MCEFVFENGKKCNEPSYQETQYCILHYDFPNRPTPQEWKKIKDLKNEQIHKKLSKGDFNFEGSFLYGCNLSNSTIKGDVNFAKAHFFEITDFSDTIFKGEVSFREAIFYFNVSFENARFEKFSTFQNAIFTNQVNFEGSIFDDDAIFNFTKVQLAAVFNNVIFKGEANFEYANFDFIIFESALFHSNFFFNSVIVKRTISFLNSTFNSNVELYLTKVGGSINFHNTKFCDPKFQEISLRIARNQSEFIGDRFEADYYFYYEMVAKIEQERIDIIRYPLTFFVQWIFGFGVKPFRIFMIWILTVMSFAIVYFLFNAIENTQSFWQYFYLSLTSAATPGFGNINPKSDVLWLAIIEGVFGTFLWAAFIATFARKFSR